MLPMGEVAVPSISKEEAAELLSPYLDLFRRCMDEAWHEWQSFYQSKHHLLDPRARAAIIHSEIANNARRYFEGLPNVQVKRARGILILNIHNRIVIRFKKLDHKHRTSNVLTRQQLLLSLNLQLPGFPPHSARLNAGYKLDDLQTAIEEMLVTAQIGREVKWEINILSRQADNLVMLTATPPEEQQTQRRRVKLKSAPLNRSLFEQ